MTDRAEWREWMSDLIFDGDGYAEVQRDMGLVRMILIRVSSGCYQGSSWKNIKKIYIGAVPVFGLPFFMSRRK